MFIAQIDTSQNSADEALEFLEKQLEKCKRKLILQENIRALAKDLIKEMMESKQDGGDFYTCTCCGSELDDNGLVRAQQVRSDVIVVCEQVSVLLLMTPLRHIQRLGGRKVNAELVNNLKDKATTVDRLK